MPRLPVRTLLAALAALAFAVGPAAATTLRTDPGGLLTGTTAFVATPSSDTATLTTATGTVTCASAGLSFDVFGAGGGVNSAHLTSMLLSPCSDTLPSVGITTCRYEDQLFHWLSITANTTGAAFRFDDHRLRCGIAGETTGCYFTAARLGGPTETATFTNVNSALTFTGMPYTATLASGTGDAAPTATCGDTATLTARFTHIVQSSTTATLTVTT